MATIDDMFNSAIGHHQAGRLPQAETLYRQVLGAVPGHADAQHLLGLLGHQSGHSEAAIGFIERAIALNPSSAIYRLNLGGVYLDLGRFDEAIASYNESLRLQPGYAEAHYNLGKALRLCGQPGDAAGHCREAIRLNPNYAEAYNNLGTALQSLGRWDEARAQFEHALRLKPDFADAFFNLGNVLRLAGRPGEALSFCQRAIELDPNSSSAHSNLGAVLQTLGRIEPARELFETAVRLDPKNHEAWANLAVVMINLRRLDEAVNACHKALELKPTFALAHVHLGHALGQKQRHSEALQHYQHALALEPRLVLAHNGESESLRILGRFEPSEASARRALAVSPNDAEATNLLGLALREQGRLSDAHQQIVRVIELQPGSSTAHYNMGILLQELGDFAAAGPSFQRAISLNPDDAEAHWNQALYWLRTGDFARGWAEYQWRWRRRSMPPRAMPQPLWRGEEFSGRTLLVHFEQGMGDTLQFVRYAPQLKQRGGTVVLECQRPLVRLLNRCAGFDQVVAAGDSLPAFDLHVPMLDLPGIFQTTLETVPADIPYLVPPEDLVRHWRDELGSQAGLKIGISWQGNPRHGRDRIRSLPLEMFEPLTAIDGVRLYSLQVGETKQPLAAIDAPIVDLGPELGDFADTAAVMVNLDLVIGCDSAPAHLAGALGRPVWVAVAATADWRWMFGREDSPWYPSMRLLRQKKLQDWSDVTARLVEDVRKLAQSKAQFVATIEEALQEAVRQHQAGRLADAERIYRQILDAVPGHADARHLLGVVAHQTGRGEVAIDSIRQAIAANPGVEGYHLNLGGVYLDQGRLAEAIDCFREALRLKPDFAPAYFNLSTALRLSGRPAEALDCCRQAILHSPGKNTEACNSLGVALQAVGRLDEAQAQFEETIRLDPGHANGYFNLGNVLRLKGRYDEAVPYCQQALRMRPQAVNAHVNLGAALMGQGRWREAIESLRTAHRMDPRDLEAMSNLATALRHRGEWDEAIALCRQAIAIDPSFGPAHLNLAYSYLVAGDFAHGWDEYELRPDAQQLSKRPFFAPRWDGSPLAGRTILLCDEQGFGDSIQFVRFIPLLVGQGARVVLECHPPLARVLRSCPGLAEVVPRGDPLPNYDVHLPLLSLAWRFRVDLATIPHDVPYLASQRELAAAWQRRLAGEGLKVGLVWQGSAHHQGDRYRSLKLRELAPHLAVSGVRYFSLQKGEGSEQLAGVADVLPIEDLGPSFADFADTAAALEQLDLLISCDSAPVHLAGALGVRTWVPLSFSPDWRWLIERDDSPWYPTVRLFRQSTIGDWQAVFERIGRELAGLAESRAAIARKC